MPLVTLYCGAFCSCGPVIEQIILQTGYHLVTDAQIIADASRLSRMPKIKIEQAFSLDSTDYNPFAYEREKTLAQIKQALAQRLRYDCQLIYGFAGYLIPVGIQQVLRICLIANRKYRIAEAIDKNAFSEQEACSRIEKEDGKLAAWLRMLFGVHDPWAASLYDMTLPADKMTAIEVASLVQETLSKDIFQDTASLNASLSDFLLASQIEERLLDAGYAMHVQARSGAVTLTVDKHVLMFHRLQREIQDIAGRMPGVVSVEVCKGPGFYSEEVLQSAHEEDGPKILLIDDERDFVQSLSERLEIRGLQPAAVAYDGEKALEKIEQDKPDVMILDLRMPGIDGIEVLKQVKKTRPHIEVIILTGRGNEADRKTCLELGAFAYLQKPADIDKLSETIRQADQKLLKKLPSVKKS